MAKQGLTGDRSLFSSFPRRSIVASSLSPQGRPGRRNRGMHTGLELLEQRRVFAALNGVGSDEFLSPLASSLSSYDLVDSSWFWSQPSVSDGVATMQVTATGDSPAEWLVRLTQEAISSMETASELQSFLDPTGLGLQIVAGLGLPGLLLVTSAGAEGDVSALLHNHSGIAYFERNAQLVTEALLPNDSRFGELYGLHNVGQSGGQIDADIDAPEAWQIETGTRSIAVSVIDTGIDPTHPDLFRNIWLNQGEIPASLRSQIADVDGDGLVSFIDLNHTANSAVVADSNNNRRIEALDLLADRRWSDRIDTDANGFIDDLFGWDFVNNDNNPSDDSRVGHGTHCAGTVGASGNDGVGVAGVSWEVSLMGLKFLSGSGSGSTANAVKSVNYATMMRLRGDERIRVTSNSWGGGGYSQSLKDAIDAGGRADILFVAAAGNSSRSTDTSPSYPASYQSQAIIAVAATDRGDKLASFSNFGGASVHLGAPGVATLSTVPGGGYANLSGTSMATPHVAGAAALALASNPSLTMAELKQAILETVDPLAALAGRTTTGGRLNAQRLLERVGDPDPALVLVGGAVREGAAPGTVAGVLAVRPASGYSFSLVAGAADNSSFRIDGDEVRTAEAFDFESRKSFTIRVRATSTAGRAVEKNFTILITDVNEPPTAINLSGGRIRDRSPAGTAVGTIAAVDPDTADSFVYALVSGEGDTDNAAFVFEGSTLRAARTIDFSGRSHLCIRVRATDAANHSVEQTFTITQQAADRYGFDTLAIEAFQAGSTLDLENLRIVNLDTGLVTYENVFDSGNTAGLTLTHWPNRNLTPTVDPTKTRVVNGRLRLESTGFGRNGAGGYDSKSRAVVNAELPANFEATFTIRKLRWEGHVYVHIVPSLAGEPFDLPHPTEGVGGLATNIQGGQINYANVLGASGMSNLLNPPGVGTTGPFLNTDVRYRIVKQGATLRMFVQDQLRAETTALRETMPVTGVPTDITIDKSHVPENAPIGTIVGGFKTVDSEVDDAFTYALVSGAGDSDNGAFRIVGSSLQTAERFDFERRANYSVRVRSTDLKGSTIEKAFAVQVTNVNEPPSAVSLVNPVASLPENADTSRPVRVADISIADDALGNTVISLAGADANVFEVVGSQLFLRAGVALNREVKSGFAVTVSVADPNLNSDPVKVTHALAIAPAVTAWTYGFRHVNDVNADRHLVESVGMRKYSEWQSTPITYWGPTTNNIEGRLVYRFDLPGKAAAARMRISLPSWDYTSTSGGQGRGAWALDVSNDGTQWVAVRNNLEPRKWGEKWSMDGPLPATVLGSGALYVRMRFLVENSPNTSYTNAQFGRSTAAATTNVFEIEATLAVNSTPTDISLRGDTVREDAPLGTLVGTLATTDRDAGDSFTYQLVAGEGDVGNRLFSIDGVSLFSRTGLDFESASSHTVRVRSTDAGGRFVDRVLTVRVTDVNEAPKRVLLTDVVSNLPENEDTSIATRIANLLVDDDALGTNLVTLAGPEAGFFEIADGRLMLKAGVSLDYESLPMLSVTIGAGDPTLPAAPPATVDYTLTLDDVEERQPAIVLSDRSIDENMPVGTEVGKFSRLDVRAEHTPLTLFYAPDEGRMWLANTTLSPLPLQAVTITSPGQKLSGEEALLPQVPFRSTNHNDSAPFGLHSEIFFANFGATALVLEAGATWEFGDVAQVGLTPADLRQFFETDPAVDEGSGERAGRFLYTLYSPTIEATQRGIIASTASTFTYEFVAGVGDEDNALFEIVGQSLRTKVAFDYEVRSRYSIRVRSVGEGPGVFEESFVIDVGDVNEAPSAIQLIEAMLDLPEDTDTSARIALGRVVVNDDALGSNLLEVVGEGAGIFEIEGGSLYLRAGTALDFEARESYPVTLRVRDGSLPTSEPVGTSFTLRITDVNEPPVAILLRNRVDSLPELVSGGSRTRVKVADIVVVDDAIGTHAIRLAGPDAAVFEVDGMALFLKTGAARDHESRSEYLITVVASDVVTGASVSIDHRLRVQDVNESPTAVVLTSLYASLPESADTSTRIHVADIRIIDDALGTNSLSLSGPDAGFFEIVGDGLWLRAGVILDFGAKPRYDVTVHAVDEQAADRLERTPLMLLYDAASGQLKLQNTTAGSLAVESVALVSPARVLGGAAARVPVAMFTVLNTSPAGLFGEHSEIFFANLGSAVLSLTAGETWDLGSVAQRGISAGRLQEVFTTDPEADPGSEPAPGQFLYTLAGSFEAMATIRGSIVTDVQAGFRLAVANVPEHSGREYIDVPEGQTVFDATVRQGPRQIVKRGAGSLVLSAGSQHSGGLLVESGRLVLRDPSAAGSGVLDVRSSASVVLDFGTSRATIGGLALSSTARIDVGHGGLRLVSGTFDARMLRQWLVSGRGRGAWDGSGIGSSAIAGTTGRGVGYRVLADGSASVAWAAFGDTNVDGRINSSDINMILAGGRFGRSGTDGVWAQGDFNYDGRVNSQDLNLLLAAGLINAPSYIAALNSGRNSSATMAFDEPTVTAAMMDPVTVVNTPQSPICVAPALAEPAARTPRVRALGTIDCDDPEQHVATQDAAIRHAAVLPPSSAATITSFAELAVAVTPDDKCRGSSVLGSSSKPLVSPVARAPAERQRVDWQQLGQAWLESGSAQLPSPTVAKQTRRGKP